MNLIDSGLTSAPTIPANVIDAGLGQPASPPANVIDQGLSVPTPTTPTTESQSRPSNLIDAGLSPQQPTGEIKSYQPSVWQRISSMFTEGNPNYSSRTVNDPR